MEIKIEVTNKDGTKIVKTVRNKEVKECSKN